MTLYHDNSAKLATSSGGVDVTGAMYASGNIGLDATDYIAWTNNTQLDFYINNVNEMRLENDGDLHVDGDVISESTVTASDINLKENVSVIDDAINKVEQLNGVEFNWKSSGKKSAGVIAQDVMEVLPQAVKEVRGLKDDDPYLTVSYDQLTGLLIEAVKELSARVKELESK